MEPIKQVEITTTQELLMSVIECRQLYGLEISSAIEQATNGKRKIPVGSLYPILKRLEKRGWIKKEWGTDTPDSRGGARRRYYSLTGEGRSALSEVRSTRQAVAAWQPA